MGLKARMLCHSALGLQEADAREQPLLAVGQLIASVSFRRAPFLDFGSRATATGVDRRSSTLNSHVSSGSLLPKPTLTTGCIESRLLLLSHGRSLAILNGRREDGDANAGRDAFRCAVAGA